MWEDDNGRTYNEDELTAFLFELGMRYPQVVLEIRAEIKYRGYTFTKLR